MDLFFLSFFLLFPFHFSIRGLESNTVLSKGSHTAAVPAGEKNEASYKSQPRPQLAQHLADLPKKLVTTQSMVPHCVMVDSALCFDSSSDLSSCCLSVWPLLAESPPLPLDSTIYLWQCSVEQSKNTEIGLSPWFWSVCAMFTCVIITGRWGAEQFWIYFVRWKSCKG